MNEKIIMLIALRNRDLPRGLQSHQLQLVLCRSESSGLRERSDRFVRVKECPVELLRPVESHFERVDQLGHQHLQLLLQQGPVHHQPVDSRSERLVQRAHLQRRHHLQLATN